MVNVVVGVRDFKIAMVIFLFMRLPFGFQMWET